MCKTTSVVIDARIRIGSAVKEERLIANKGAPSSSLVIPLCFIEANIASFLKEHWAPQTPIKLCISFMNIKEVCMIKEETLEMQSRIVFNVFKNKAYFAIQRVA